MFPRPSRCGPSLGVSGTSFQRECDLRVAARGLLLATAAAGAAWAQPAADVTAADLRAHVELLAGDAAAGRDTGSPEALAAARAMAALLRDAGLQPAGDPGAGGDDAFLQAIDLSGFAFDGEPSLVTLAADGTRTPRAFGADFEYAAGPPRSGTFAVVRAAAGVDPPQAPRADAALLLAGSRRATSEWLTAGGAPRGAGWGVLLLAGSAGPGPGGRGESRGTWTHPAPGAAPPAVRLWVHGALLEGLRSGAVASLELSLRAAEVVPAVNVAALLPGAGAPGREDLARELVVVTAHYDHLGRAAAPTPPPAEAHGSPALAAPDAAPDLVYNGADDDASGCAAVLELAHALSARAAAGRPPARSVLFLLVTGEERGLLGTEFWLDHPPVPLERVALNLNFEMLGRPDPAAGGAGRLWLTGFERSNLGPAWAAAGLPVVADPHPEQHFFQRSDNYAFVQRGRVGQTLSSYGLHEQYHTVDDELELLDFAHMETAVRAALRALETVADGDVTPAWVEGQPGR